MDFTCPPTRLIRSYALTGRPRRRHHARLLLTQWRLLRRRGCGHEGGVELSQSLGLLTNYDTSVINEEL